MNILSASTHSLALFGSYYSTFGVICFSTLLLLCVLPIGSIKLGTAPISYSRTAWLTMLYSTGMGTGLLLRAVQEPIYYLQNPPLGITAPVEALKFTFFHWGFTAWSFYSLFGLFYSLSSSKAARSSEQKNFTHLNFLTQIEQGIISFSTILGVVASVTLGSFQWTSGAAHLTQNTSLIDQTGFVVFLVVAASCCSALSGLQKGIRWLSNINILLAVFVMLFIFFSDFSFEIFTLFKDAFCSYLQNFFAMSLNLGSQATSLDFRINWTYFYWAFWLSWAPFTGLFLAKISEGRSIREFVIFTLLIPSLGSLVWFTVFAQSSFQRLSTPDSQVFSSIYLSLFLFLDYFPLSEILKTIALINVLTFLITSVDSALFVIADQIYTFRKVIRHKIKIILSATLILVSSLFLTLNGSSDLLNTISHILILCSLPVSLLGGFYLLWICFHFAKSFKK